MTFIDGDIGSVLPLVWICVWLISIATPSHYMHRTPIAPSPYPNHTHMVSDGIVNVP